MPSGELRPGLRQPSNVPPCCSQWWRRQWVEEFFPPVSLGDPTLDTLLRQFGLQVGRHWVGGVAGVTLPHRGGPHRPSSILHPQDKSPPRARSSSNTLAQALRWVRKQLSPLEPSTLLWGLLAAVGAIRVMQALHSRPHSPQSSPPAKEEKHKPAAKKDSGAASKQAAPAPDNCTSSSQTPGRKK